jgi:hypothetical protein
MAAFPSTPAPTYSYILEPEWKTLITPFDSGKEQRRQKWVYSKYNARLSYYGLNSTDCETVWKFYQARKGSYEAFHFFDPVDASSHIGLYVGVGDSSAVNYDIPGKETSNRTIYINGVATTSVSFTTAAGTDGSDQMTFVSAPTSTQTITCSFQGKLRIRCRFEDDKLSRENFDKALFSYGINLKGLSAI